MTTTTNPPQSAPALHAAELADSLALRGTDGTPQAPLTLSRRGADTTVGGAFASSRVPLAPGAIALTGGFPGADVLPIAELSQAYQSVLAEPNAGRAALGYHGPFGTDELRAWVAARLGVPAAQTVITNGALHSVSYALETIVEPGDTVVVENPTYPYALRLLQYHGARVLGVPADGHGLDVDAFEALLAAGERPKALYVIPDFQNPSGVTLSAQRRNRLVELAQQYGFLIISDNPYRELRFAGEEIPDFPVESDRVLLAGTFSKVLGPGLRLGWAVLPTWLVGPAVRVRSNTDQHAGLLTQRAVEHVTAQPGLFDQVVAGARAAYKERSQALYDALTAALGDRFEADRPEGGLFLWATIHGADLDRTLDNARAAGTDFTLGRSFDPAGRGAHSDRIRMSYSAATPDALRRAAQIIADAIVPA